MKLEAAFFRGVAFVSVSVFAIMYAYKLGKEQHRADTVSKAPEPHDMISLDAGQTILAVSDRRQSMHFHIGNSTGHCAHDE